VETHVVLADHHIPFQDDAAIAAAHLVARRAKPDVIWLLGDVIDFAPISRFRDAERYEHSVQDEIDETLDYLLRLDREFPNASIRYMLGNHEHRLKHYLWGNAPKIKGLRTARFEHQFRFDRKDRAVDLPLTFFHQPRTFARKSFILKHGARSCLYSTRWECEDEGRSGLSGHIHRTGTWAWRTPGSGLRIYHHIGCLCRLDPKYKEEDGEPAHWNHGMGMLYVEPENIGVDNIIIDRGVAYWRGTRYSA